MKHRSLWEIDVPIKDDTGRTGWHVFAGLATDRAEALKAAQDVYREAVRRQQDGDEIPAGNAKWDWSARALRPGWDLDWNQAELHERIQ
ncbi:hypothetical protein AS594_39300 [Streptomyces agglomeratus]|uniref:Uncharacterized protein n=1 Tax=Streptomyces agglomeratus TaxID=285458 RepID=A0A1E5NZG6_9ACTN|nr:hypothetical protein [Streptomyces agglomeratus]OEJ21581.1 hypothetical protein AS594_39300 [Streptomyces agglomeratus]